MCERVEGTACATETPIGFVPCAADLDLVGLNVPLQDVNELLRVDRPAWQAEMADIERHFAQFGDRLPERLRWQVVRIQARL